MLSDEELKALQQIEDNLYKSDQKLAEKLRNPGRVKAQAIVLGTVGIIAGLVIVILGITSNITLLGILGFLVMLAVSVVSFSKIQKLSTPLAKPETSKTGIYTKLEERWRNRQQEN